MEYLPTYPVWTSWTVILIVPLKIPSTPVNFSPFIILGWQSLSQANSPLQHPHACSWAGEPGMGKNHIHLTWWQVHFKFWWKENKDVTRKTPKSLGNTCYKIIRLREPGTENINLMLPPEHSASRIKVDVKGWRSVQSFCNKDSKWVLKQHMLTHLCCFYSCHSKEPRASFRKHFTLTAVSWSCYSKKTYSITQRWHMYEMLFPSPIISRITKSKGWKGL